VTVDDDSGYSAAVFAAVADLSRRLAEDDLAIYAFDYDYLAFGSWVMVAGSRHRRMRLRFDGKEDHLEVSEAEVGDSRSSPAWRPLHSPTLKRGIGVDPVAMFEAVGAVITGSLRSSTR
jgi:hypothetical protein